MRAIVRHELRQLAGARLLWVGLALTGLLVYQARSTWWPVLAGGDLNVLRDAYLLGGVLLLLWAELASRDRRTGVADLVEATPTAAARLLGWRLAAVAALAAGAFAALWLAAMAWLAVRGGRGLPDPRLLADGVLASVLAAGAGVALGGVVKARLASLLAAVVWVAGSFAWADLDQVQHLGPSLQWLSPRFGRATRSAIAGILPDLAWARLGWLAGLVAVVAGGLLVAAAGRRAVGPLAALAAGAVLAVASASVLVAAPDRVWFRGPGTHDWAAFDRTGQLAGWTVDGSSIEAATETGPPSDGPAAYPDDGRSTRCASSAHLTVCGVPAFGGLAGRTTDLLEPVAARAAPLPIAVKRIRIVPPTGGYGSTCRAGEMLMTEDEALFEAALPPPTARSNFAACMFGPELEPSEAGEVVIQWLMGPTEYPGVPPLPGDWASDAAAAMSRLPDAEVQTVLVRDWDRIAAGKLPASALPGQHR